MYKVLIVEDEPLVTEAMTTLLSSKMDNIKVVGTADNGREGIEKFRELEPDIVLMDIHIPNINGLDLSNQIKKIRPNTSIIIVTAYSEFNYAQKAIQINVDDYILKPARPDRIISSINRSITKLEEARLVSNRHISRDRELEFNFLLGDYRKVNNQIASIFQVDREDYEAIYNIKETIKNNLLGLGEKYNFQKKYLQALENRIEIAHDKSDLLIRYLQVSKEVFYKVWALQKKESLEDNEIFLSLQYIEFNLERDLRLDEVADQVHISPSYYSKLFKKELGINFVDYLRERRIHLAKLLLRNTGLSINEISILVGFNESNYFSRVFREKEGISPTSYRNGK